MGVSHADIRNLIGIADSSFYGRHIFWCGQALDHQTYFTEGVIEKFWCPGVLGRRSVAHVPVENLRADNLVIPAGEVRTVQAGSHTVQHGRAPESVAHVFFPGPDQFDRHLQLIGHSSGFLDVILGQPATESATQEGGVYGHVIR